VIKPVTSDLMTQPGKVSQVLRTHRFQWVVVAESPPAEFPGFAIPSQSGMHESGWDKECSFDPVFFQYLQTVLRHQPESVVEGDGESEFILIG